MSEQDDNVIEVNFSDAGTELNTSGLNKKLVSENKDNYDKVLQIPREMGEKIERILKEEAKKKNKGKKLAEVLEISNKELDPQMFSASQSLDEELEFYDFEEECD